MANGPVQPSVGRLARSVIQSLGHFTVPERDMAALTHGDGRRHGGARISGE